MKKSIISYTVLFIFAFLFHWFFAEIYSMFTPFSFIVIYPVILIAIVVMTIWAVILVIKKWKAFRWKAAVPLIIMVLMVAVPFFIPFEKARVYTEFILYTRQRETVADMVASDPLFVDKTDAALPKKYRHLSCDGNIYIEKKTEDQLVIGFWVFRGLSVNGYSMVYYNSTQDEITLRRLIEDDISVMIQLNPSWYYVVTE